MDECIEILQDILNHIDSNCEDEFFREIRGIKLSKDEVIRRFQPIFSPMNIDQLDAKSYRAFLQFNNNKHWTGLYRKGNSASANIDEGELYEEEISFPEGRAVFRTHKFYERNSNLVQKKKQGAQEKGQLRCCICNFNFHEVYGEIGKGFIECHHVVPVSTYSSDTTTMLEDLVLVCSNCHRILHRQRPCLSIEEMRTNVSINKGEKQCNSVSKF